MPKPPLRILLSNHTPVAGSGSGTYTAMLARGLVKAGHRVCVLSPMATQFPIGPGVERRSVMGLPRSFPSFTGHPLSVVTYDQLDEQELDQLLTAWREAFHVMGQAWQPDVVHVQHLWVLARAAQLTGYWPVVTCHGSEIAFAGTYPNLAGRLLPAPASISASICISEYVASRAEPVLEHVPQRYTLPNPYDDGLFGLRPDHLVDTEGNGPHLGFVGRLVAYKGCDRFLHCVARLRRQVPTLTASIVGDGPERQRLHDLACELDLRDAITFWGQISQTQLANHYQRFDLLVVPSQNEPFGLVALESVACGTPAVVAKSGGLAELIHPPFILGYDMADDHLGARHLDEKVLQVLARRRSADFAWQAAAYAQEHYSLARYVQQLESIYRQVLSSSHPGK